MQHLLCICVGAGLRDVAAPRQCGGRRQCGRGRRILRQSRLQVRGHSPSECAVHQSACIITPVNKHQFYSASQGGSLHPIKPSECMGGRFHWRLVVRLHSGPPFIGLRGRSLICTISFPHLSPACLQCTGAAVAATACLTTRSRRRAGKASAGWCCSPRARRTGSSNVTLSSVGRLSRRCCCRQRGAQRSTPRATASCTSRSYSYRARSCPSRGNGLGSSRGRMSGWQLVMLRQGSWRLPACIRHRHGKKVNWAPA